MQFAQLVKLAVWPHVLQVMASKADTGSAGKAAAAASAPPSQMKLQTLLLHPAASSVNDPYDASGPPLYQTATFGQPSATEGGQFDYSRSGNPTRTMLEEQVCVRCFSHMVWCCLAPGARIALLQLADKQDMQLASACTAAPCRGSCLLHG
jgi:hypothetical protein